MSTVRTATRLRLLPLALIAVGMLVLAALLVARSSDSGRAATQARSLPPFTSVVLAGHNNVVVRVGGRQSVVVHADSNLLRRVTTRVHRGRLVIGTTPGNLASKTPMFVAVSLPSLDGLSLPGDGTISATGSTPRLDVSISGHGTALLLPLVARDAHATLSGDGTIMLTATRSLTASISGTGTVLYGGNPSQVDQRVTGSGTIVAANP